jgi:DNA-binding NarL/FixJ family response regulator
MNGEILMPAKRRLTMRQLRQMLRLAGSGTRSREIAVVLGIARSTVQDNPSKCSIFAAADELTL